MSAGPSHVSCHACVGTRSMLVLHVSRKRVLVTVAPMPAKAAKMRRPKAVTTVVLFEAGIVLSLRSVAGIATIMASAAKSKAVMVSHLVFYRHQSGSNDQYVQPHIAYDSCAISARTSEGGLESIVANRRKQSCKNKPVSSRSVRSAKTESLFECGAEKDSTSEKQGR